MNGLTWGVLLKCSPTWNKLSTEVILTSMASLVNQAAHGSPASAFWVWNLEVGCHTRMAFTRALETWTPVPQQEPYALSYLSCQLNAFLMEMYAGCIHFHVCRWKPPQKLRNICIDTGKISKWMKCGQPGNLGEGKWELFVLFPQNYENKIAS